MDGQGGGSAAARRENDASSSPAFEGRFSRADRLTLFSFVTFRFDTNDVRSRNLQAKVDARQAWQSITREAVSQETHAGRLRVASKAGAGREQREKGQAKTGANTGQSGQSQRQRQGQHAGQRVRVARQEQSRANQGRRRRSVASFRAIETIAPGTLKEQKAGQEEGQKTGRCLPAMSSFSFLPAFCLPLPPLLSCRCC